MISGDRSKLGPNPGCKPERSVRRTLGAASDASVLACCTGQAQNSTVSNQHPGNLGFMGQPSAAREGVFFVGLAVALAGVPIVLFRSYPIAYAHLVAEDFEGEYATMVAYLGAGLLFLVDARRAPARSRKAISLAIGLVALLIAGEEVSWGQRIWSKLLGFHVPEFIEEANRQSELNLHNLEGVGVSLRAYAIGSYLMLGWLAVSALLSWIRPGIAARLIAAGIPVVPLRLAPMCLLTPAFFLLQPVAKSDEIGELLLGVTALTFALDHCRGSRWFADGWLPARPKAVVTSLVVVGLVASALAAASPMRRIAGRLNSLATRDYPGFGMYEQAEEIFDYIYRHPTELQRWNTRLDHVEMLVAAGKMAAAREMMPIAVEEVNGDPPAPRGERLSRIGQLYAAVGDKSTARAAFAAAMAADRNSLQTVDDANARAELMWSMARTLLAEGRTEEARREATQARQTAMSGRLRFSIERWLQDFDSTDDQN